MVSTFWAVFSAVMLAEFFKELYERYVKRHVKGSLDSIEKIDFGGLKPPRNDREY